MQEKLSTLEYIIGMVPLLLLAYRGGFLGAMFGVIGTGVSYNFMAAEKRVLHQIGFTLLATAIVYVIYFIFVITLLSLLFYH